MLFGGIALVVALFVYRRARKTGAWRKQMATTPTLPVAQLEAMRRQVVRPNPQGGFRMGAEVVGVAQPGPRGLLSAEVSKTPCVWCRYRVQERTYHTSDGHRHERWEKVAEGQSVDEFLLVDRYGGRIQVRPGGVRVEHVEKTVDAYRRDATHETVDVFGLQWSRGRGTLGYRYEEWIIRPGAWLYVLGEAQDVTGPLVMSQPADGSDFLISGKSEADLSAEVTRRHELQMAGVIALLVVVVAEVAFDIWLYNRW